MLIFEQSKTGRGTDVLGACDVPLVQLDVAHKRASTLHLAEVSEVDVDRHYTALAKKCHGVNDGFYPLGSCTMKYNPRLNEAVANLPGFTDIHPLQPAASVQGALAVMQMLEVALCEITGMDALTLQPAAGAHGELTGLLLIKAYYQARGDAKRRKIIVPDSAHGTNPASATMAGYTIVNVASGPDGCVDLSALEAACNEEVAGLMLTNPNTVGLFDKNIRAITELVHNCGGLCYYDGANLNAVMGQVRPGDMGFDVVHLNLHKTFSTPHGGGGPGSGPVGCKAILADFLPNVRVAGEDGARHFMRPAQSIGEVKAFYGNFLVYLRALTYILSLGAEGIKEASENAVLNANYMRVALADLYKMAYDGTCMHEFVMDLSELKKATGVSALDIAKGLLDNGIHPPTMYFPLIVHEALMIEPTETESRETLDAAIQVFRDLYRAAQESADTLHAAPQTTPVGRLDEVQAARKPVLRYDFDQ
ncbi:MAG: aminomethyl-transferring glycine dehydrogenase subunit GcvPB [Peptococcaceae bacterium]|nr:aminomethyl-transferring glycine dehydrogenase subunit GcvPB [Peptococcaceae bacterium]